MSATITAGVAEPLWGTAATDAETRAARTSAGARLWDGTVVTTTQTPQCSSAFGFTDLTGPTRAVYRPHLKASDPKAAVILYDNNVRHIIVIRATTNTTQMQGNNVPYCGIHFDPSLGESQTWLGGTYTFNVTPATVTAATNEVRVTGRMTKFANIPGCTLTFRAAFLRQPPDQP